MNPVTVFTKPWKSLSPEALAERVNELGFDGVELAVRPGYQVEPENAVRDLPLVAEVFRRAGLQIFSVASEMSPRMIEACDRADVPMIRTMLPLSKESGYHASVAEFQRQCIELEPALQNRLVRIGVQNHCDNFVGTAVGLMEALAPLPDAFEAVLDFAHTSLCGEPEPYAMEIARPRLGMINLKNAKRVVRARNARGEAVWDRQWVTAREGLTSWSLVVRLLEQHAFDGPVCLTCEYRDADLNGLAEEAVLPLIREDMAYIKELLNKNNDS